MKLATAIAALAAAVVLAATAQVRIPSASAPKHAARVVVEAPLLRAEGGATQGKCAPDPATTTQPPVEADAPTPVVPSSTPAKRERFSNVRDLSPLDEIDAAVGLTDDQRPVVTGLVIEREAAMHAAYSEAVLERGDREAGIAGVTEIYESYHVQIRRALTTDQQARLDEARRAGRVGKPMFVFTYGSE